MNLNAIVGKVDLEIVPVVGGELDIGIKVVNDEHLIIQIKRDRMFNILKNRKFCAGSLNQKLSDLVEKHLRDMARNEDDGFGR